MKEKLILALVTALSVSNPLFAEPLPFGCYVTDDERNLYVEPPTCYVIQGPTFSFLTPANTTIEGLMNAYGDVTASFIKLGYDADIGRLQCIDAFNTKAALERRLRRACGARCKRIR